MAVKLPVMVVVVVRRQKVERVHVQRVDMGVVGVVVFQMMMVFLGLDRRNYADFTVARTISLFVDSNELRHR